MGGCCSSKLPEPEGFNTYGKMNLPGSEPLGIINSPVQSLSTNVFEKQTNSTPLLKDVSFAPVDDNTDTSSDSIDDEEIENLLNQEEANSDSNQEEEAEAEQNNNNDQTNQ